MPCYGSDKHNFLDKDDTHSKPFIRSFSVELYIGILKINTQANIATCKKLQNLSAKKQEQQLPCVKTLYWIQHSHLIQSAQKNQSVIARKSKRKLTPTVANWTRRHKIRNIPFNAPNGHFVFVNFVKIFVPFVIKDRLLNHKVPKVSRYSGQTLLTQRAQS